MHSFDDTLRFTNAGECGEPSSRRDHCWREAIAAGARVPFHGVVNVSLTGQVWSALGCISWL
jgi:hypothetical protein